MSYHQKAWVTLNPMEAKVFMGGSACTSIRGGSHTRGSLEKSWPSQLPSCDPWYYRALDREHWSDSSSFFFPPLCQRGYVFWLQRGHAGNFIEHPLSPGPLCDFGHKIPLWQLLVSPTLGGHDLTRPWS